LSNPIIEDLVAYILPCLHERRIEAYKISYKKRHNGDEPASKDIDTFVGFMIAAGGLEKEAEDIACALIEKVSKPYKRHSIRLDRGIKSTIVSMLLLFTYVMNKKQLPDFLMNEYTYYSVVSVLFVLIASIIFSLALDIFYKDTASRH
jgi:hypothetical protein